MKVWAAKASLPPTQKLGTSFVSAQIAVHVQTSRASAGAALARETFLALA